MLQTLELIIAKQIEKTFGRCGSCNRYRGCCYKSESKILCPDCITCLRNQRRLTIIESKINPSPVKKIKVKIPRIRKDKPPKTKKKINLVRNFFGRGLLQAEILNLLKKHKTGFSCTDIARKLRASPSSAWVTITRLVESNQVVYTGKQRNRIYAHPCHADVLEKYKGVCVPNIPTIEKVKKALDASDRITCTLEIYNTFKDKKSKPNILCCLRFLVARGDALSYFDHQENREKFASTANKKALYDFNNNQPQHKILNFLKEGIKNKQEIANHLGNVRRCTAGVSKILAELQEQGKVELAKSTRRGIFFQLKA